MMGKAMPETLNEQARRQAWRGFPPVDRRRIYTRDGCETSCARCGTRVWIRLVILGALRKDAEPVVCAPCRERERGHPND